MYKRQVGDSEIILSATSILSDPPETGTCPLELSELQEALMRQRIPRNAIRLLFNFIIPPPLSHGWEKKLHSLTVPPRELMVLLFSALRSDLPR